MKPWRPHVRLLLDTNVLIAGLLSAKGPPGVLLDAWLLEYRFDLITSRPQIDELERTLDKDYLRAKINEGQRLDLLENLDARAMLVEDLPDVDASTDPDDNLILATAIAGNADALITGDKGDLLVLKRVEGIPILSPRAGLELIGLDDR